MGLFLFQIFIYSFGCTRSSLRHVESFFFFFNCNMWDILVVECGVQFPDQGLNLGPLHWVCGILATRPSRKFQVYFLQEEKALFLTGVCVCVCGVYELRWKWMVNTWRNVRREIKLISCHGPVPDTTESFILSHLFSKVHCEVGVSLHSHLICEEIEPQRDASKAHVSRVLWSQDKIQNKIACLQKSVSSYHLFILPL